MHYVVFLNESEEPVVIEQVVCTDHMNVVQVYAERIGTIAVGD